MTVSAVDHEFAAFDKSNPNCVVLGDAQDRFSYANMNQAFQILLNNRSATLVTLGSGYVLIVIILQHHPVFIIICRCWSSSVSADLPTVASRLVFLTYRFLTWHTQRIMILTTSSFELIDAFRIMVMVL